MPETTTSPAHSQLMRSTALAALVAVAIALAPAGAANANVSVAAPVPAAPAPAPLPTPAIAIAYDVEEYRRRLDPFITFKEAAKIRRCHVSHLYVLAGLKRIRVKKDGKKSLIDTASLLNDMLNLPEANIAPPWWVAARKDAPMGGKPASRKARAPKRKLVPRTTAAEPRRAGSSP